MNIAKNKGYYGVILKETGGKNMSHHTTEKVTRFHKIYEGEIIQIHGDRSMSNAKIGVEVKIEGFYDSRLFIGMSIEETKQFHVGQKVEVLTYIRTVLEEVKK